MIKRIYIIIVFLLIFGLPKLIAQQVQGAFIENIGQYPSTVKYYSEFSGGIIFVEDTCLTYSLRDPKSFKQVHDHVEGRNMDESVENYAFKVRFSNTELKQEVIADKKLSGTHNYFLDKNPENWVSGARSYSKVTVNNLYPGVDLDLSIANGQLKYDLLLDPGVDPSIIQMQYDGVTDLKIDKNGDLAYEIPYQQLTEKIPASYAICFDEQRKIKASYIVDGQNVSFRTSDVDASERVVIDPLLVFSTYSGSPSDNWGNTATFDNEGNAYAGGITNVFRDELLGEFPTTTGAFQSGSAGGWDVAIMKFDSTGSNLLYATHLGGSGSDVPQSLIVDENGDLLILGVTSSPNFPVTSNATDTSYNGGTSDFLIGTNGISMSNGSDLFVTKLSNDGTELLGSTFLGGRLNDGMLDGADPLARNYGDESRGDINFDSDGSIVIASRTASPDFPLSNAFDSTFNGLNEAVLVKLSPGLDSLMWSTFIGGEGSDVALSIKVDSNDDLFVAGGTTSVDFPITDSAYLNSYNGEVDGWVAHVQSSGDSLIASSYIGTSAYDQTFFLDLDADENVYLLGQTTAEYPVSVGKYSSGKGGIFLHKLSNNLRESIFSTTLGAAGSILPPLSLTAFLVNECDNIYISGWGSYLSIFNDGNNFSSFTTGLPVTFDAYQQVSDGSSFYLAVLSGDATELLYATHLGNSASFVHVDGGTSRFDKNGIVYHSVCASCGADDSSFPTTAGAYSEVNASSGCSNAIFKFDLASLRARIQTNNIELTEPGLNGGCNPLPIVFENFTTGGQVYEWDFGDGSTRTVYTKDTIHYTYKTSGSFRVQLRAYDPNTCIAEDWAFTNITVSEPIFTVTEDQDICFGTPVRLIATGGTSYEWFPKEGLDNPLSGSPIANPSDTVLYTVDITNTNGCSYQGSVLINVIPEIIPKIQVEQSNLCEGSREIKLINESENAESITWSLGDGSVIDSWTTNYEFEKDGEYQISGVLRSDKCIEQVDIDLNIIELNIPNVITRNNDGYNDVLKITSANPVNLKIYTRWGTQVFEAVEYANDWSGQGLRTGIYFYESQLSNGEVCSGWIQLLNDSQ